MKIYGIKCRDVMACPGAWALLAEAEVEAEDGVVYVLAQSYDTLELTVSKQSLYGFLAEDGAEPEAVFMEEYVTWKDAKASAYAEVFEKLKKVLKMLG